MHFLVQSENEDERWPSFQKSKTKFFSNEMLRGPVTNVKNSQTDSEINLNDLLSAKRNLGFLQGFQQSSNESSPNKEHPSPQAFRRR